MFEVAKKILEDSLYYDGTMILKYHIEYPSISSNLQERGIVRFNDYNKMLAYALKQKAENELYQEAVETYQYNKENNYPIMVYEVYRSFEVTYNRCPLISLYSDEYTFTGGAHGSTIRTSQTWELPRGNRVQLARFFPYNPYFILDILKEINRQIAENPTIYFENTCNLVLETFNPKSFYLTPDGIVIYFQQYDIAPYSSGIRTFII